MEIVEHVEREIEPVEREIVERASFLFMGLYAR